MSGVAARNEVDWLAPAPLWGAAGVRPQAPAVARFEGDDFMDRFARLLAAPPPDSAAGLAAARPAVAAGGMPGGVLYQPVHGCYALACASLTCRAPGRPEKGVAPAAGETVGFVLRRLEDDDDTEAAWVPAAGGQGRWTPDAGPDDGEEVLPLFPVPAAGDPPRRVWAGLVPTASREMYPDGPAGPDGPLLRPKFDTDPRRLYVVRCVYLRRDCPPVVSDRSDRFGIAPVYDPTAPARTIRIPMPIDTSVAGLQKLKRNVGFLISKALNKQAGALSGNSFKDIDDKKRSGDEPAEGVDEICTFALPVITLCAMIVLFVFLAALNFVFQWLPFLKICLPIPAGGRKS